MEIWRVRFRIVLVESSGGEAGHLCHRAGVELQGPHAATGLRVGALLGASLQSCAPQLPWKSSTLFGAREPFQCSDL